MSSNENEDSKEIHIIIPELESVSNQEPSSIEAYQMMGDASSAASISKMMFYEAAVSLLQKDLSFADFTRDVLLAVMKSFRCEAGTIFELNHVNQVFFFRACVGQISDRLPGFEIPIHKGIVGQVAETRKSVLVNDLQKNETHFKALGGSLGFEARNMIAMPLCIRGQLYGVLELFNRVGADQFSEVDYQLGQELAVILSKIIEIRLMLGGVNRMKKELKVA